MITAGKLVANMVSTPWYYYLFYYLFFSPCALILIILLIVIIAVIVTRRKEGIRSLSDKVGMLFTIYYISLGIVGIALVLGGIVSLCVSEIPGVIIFGAVQFILGVFIIVLSAILEKRKHEIISSV